MNKDTLRKLQEDYSELSKSITTENKNEHDSIVRQMSINVDNQERFLNIYDY